jgi:NAD(P)H-dependent flavin oxidoreductase YrpB (nitropropane dioxygenase family)
VADLIERIGLEVPIVQAGMGGGLAGADLAATVSEAGGLGTIGILGPDQLRAEIAAARRLTDRPIAVNLLLPLARPAHFQVAERGTPWSPSGAGRAVEPTGRGSTRWVP